MRQKETKRLNKNSHEIAKFGWQKRKKILELLADGKHRVKDLAAEYHTEEKMIHRIREKAIKEFYLINNQLTEEVQDYLRYWALKHDKNLVEVSPLEEYQEKLKRHKEDLAGVAKEVLDKLNTYIIWDDNMLIDEINLEKDDLKTIGFFQDQLVIGLFTHLKHDLPELASFSRWEDLRVKDITFELTNKISMKAARREFKDECRVCEVWRQK